MAAWAVAELHFDPVVSVPLCLHSDSIAVERYSRMSNTHSSFSGDCRGRVAGGSAVQPFASLLASKWCQVASNASEQVPRRGGRATIDASLPPKRSLALKYERQSQAATAPASSTKYELIMQPRRRKGKSVGSGTVSPTRQDGLDRGMIARRANLEDGRRGLGDQPCVCAAWATVERCMGPER